MSKEYNCISCNYSTTNKSSFQKHLKTKKHVRLHPQTSDVSQTSQSSETSQTSDVSQSSETSENTTVSLTMLELHLLISQISLNERKKMIHQFEEIIQPLKRDIHLFKIPIHVETNNETFDKTLKAICITNVLSEEQIHKIQIIANELTQNYRIDTLHDPDYFNMYKYDLKEYIKKDETINECITFVYE